MIVAVRTKPESIIKQQSSLLRVGFRKIFGFAEVSTTDRLYTNFAVKYKYLFIKYDRKLCRIDLLYK